MVKNLSTEKTHVPHLAAKYKKSNLIPSPRRQFQSYKLKLETLREARTHEGAGYQPYKPGLRGLRGRYLICAIWGVKKSWKEAFFEV